MYSTAFKKPKKPSIYQESVNTKKPGNLSWASNAMFTFKEVPYTQWGPWTNFWGYTTTIAQFADDDIILKSETPYNTRIVKRFCDWEDCERALMLIEQDRRF